MRTPRRRTSRQRRRWGLAAVVALTLSLLATITHAAVVQQGDLRVTLQAQVRPFKLPRHGRAPIDFFVSGHVAAVHGGVPEQLQRISVKVNENAKLDFRGFPVCRLSEVQPATSTRALRDCGPAIIGAGRFWLDVVFPEQGNYPTEGRLLLFNGRYHHRPALLAHIFTAHPFAASFVLVFRLRKLSRGVYDSEFAATLPQALGAWGYLDRIKLTMRGDRRTGARRHSFFSAGCPAPPGVSIASYRLALATLAFKGTNIAMRLDKTCAVKE